MDAETKALLMAAMKVLTVAGDLLTQAISITPTGELRNNLTEVNIHRMSAELKAKELIGKN